MPNRIEQRIVEGMEELVHDLQTGADISSRYVTRKVVRRRPFAATPQAVRGIRKLLHLSQQDLAEFLGVTSKTIDAWERGTKAPNTMARRFLEEIQQDPRHFKKRVQAKTALQ